MSAAYLGAEKKRKKKLKDWTSAGRPEKTKKERKGTCFEGPDTRSGANCAKGGSRGAEKEKNAERKMLSTRPAAKKEREAIVSARIASLSSF